MVTDIVSILPIVVILLASVGGRFLLSYSTASKGWSSIAKNYSVSVVPENLSEIKFSSMKIGKGYYKNCVHVSVTTKGVYLRLFSLLKMFHPPLFIPWNAIKYDKNSNPISFNRHILEVNTFEGVTITINNNLFVHLDQYLKSGDYIC